MSARRSSVRLTPTCTHAPHPPHSAAMSQSTAIVARRAPGVVPASLAALLLALSLLLLL